MSNTGLVHHIEIYVSNLKLSIEFWGWLLPKLGYEIYNQWSEGISYTLGETYLVFVQTEKKYLDIPYHRKRSGLNHLAFHVESKESVDRWTRELQERGVPILYEDKHPFAGGKEYYAVFFEDPDRMKVELVAPKI